jgi:integrase
VIYVPKRLHPKLGKKLRVSLKTRDLHVAQFRRHAAVAEFMRLIRDADKSAADPRMDEAFAWRGIKEQAKRGEVVNLLGDPDDDEAQAGVIDYLFGDRVEIIRAEEGDKAARAFAAIASGEETPLRHHLPDWLAEGGRKGAYRGRSKAGFESDLKRLAAWMADAELPPTVEAIDRKQAGAFVTHLRTKEGLAPKTVAKIVSTFRSYWVFLGIKGGAAEERTPWDRQAPPKGAGSGLQQDEEREFTDAEVITLLNGSTDAELHDAMRIGALTGMRLEEIYQLTVADCAGGLFNIRGGKTKAAKRKVPIHPALSPIVERRTTGKDATDYLFPEPGIVKPGRERSMAASKRFGHYRKRVGVDERGVDERGEIKRRSLVNFHSFRRWFTTAAVRQGQALHVVQQVIGHARQGVTLGKYHGGDTAAALRACVEAVQLPAGANDGAAATESRQGRRRGPRKARGQRGS